MSRFLKLLESVRRGGHGFGFTARAAAAPPSMVVLAVVPGVQAEVVRATAQAGADAVALAATWAELQDGAALKAAVDASGEKPLGLMLASADQGKEPQADWWGKSGLDFLVVGSDQPAALLAVEGAKLVSLRLDFDPMQARALDGLEVEGFVVASQDESQTGFTIGDVARYRLLASGTGKPVLAALSGASDQAELKALSQAGIDGVVLLPAALSPEVAAAGQIVARMKDEILRLGPRRAGKNRASQGTPLLPRVGAGASEEQEEGDQ